MCSSSAWLLAASSLAGCRNLLQQVAVPGTFPLSPYLCFCSGRRYDEEPRGGLSSVKGWQLCKGKMPVFLPLCYWVGKMGKGTDSTS